MEDGFCRADYPLNRIHADVWDGHIFVNFSPEPRPLALQLEDLPEKFAAWRMAELCTYRRIEYQVNLPETGAETSQQARGQHTALLQSVWDDKRAMLAPPSSVLDVGLST